MDQAEQTAWMVDARGLSKVYPRRGDTPITAVNDTSLHIRKGEIFSLLGPNGAGKTTTISMLCGLAKPTTGDALIGGYSITQQPIEAKSLLGVVPQAIALYMALTARQNLEFFGKLQGMAGAELARLVDEVLDFVDLKERQHDKVETFSGGMQRRVNLAVGLLHKPRLLFLDEPTVGIDPQNRRRILDMALRLRAEQGITILYTSHLMEEVQEISDRVAIMDHGQIIAQGTMGELIQLVGEEDRLVLKVGTQTVTDEVLRALQSERITSVDLVREPSLNGANGAPDTTNGSTEPILGQPAEIVILAKRGRSALPHLLMKLNEAGVEVQSIEVREPDLEAVFLNLTGRQLRD